MAASNLSHEEQLKLVTDLEMEMMADMYNRYVFEPICLSDIQVLKGNPAWVAQSHQIRYNQAIFFIPRMPFTIEL